MFEDRCTVNEEKVSYKPRLGMMGLLVMEKNQQKQKTAVHGEQKKVFMG